MEYMSGGNLSDWLERNRGNVSKAELQRIFRQILMAIEYCHNRGIVHRDLKLENVLMSGDDIPKVTDFGVAHDETQANTTTTYLGYTHGTICVAGLCFFSSLFVSFVEDIPLCTNEWITIKWTLCVGYEPPEVVFLRQRWTKASDMYTFGVMLYRCLQPGKELILDSVKCTVSYVRDGLDAHARSLLGTIGSSFIV